MSRVRAARRSGHGLGRAGEAEAEAVLRRAGLRIVKRRFRCRLGEVDLIARDGDVTVFVEVKTRRGFGYGYPAEAVTARKRERLARVALAYLARRGRVDAPCRFDVVEVVARTSGELVATHLRDAFRLWPTG